MILTPSSGPPVADWKKRKRGREEKTNINATSLLKARQHNTAVTASGYGGRGLFNETASQTNYTIL